jgi:septal ring factor EnvC (AmiA/AmiB activator)
MCISRLFVLFCALALSSQVVISQEVIIETPKSMILKQIAIELNLTLQQQDKVSKILQGKQIVSEANLIELENIILQQKSSLELSVKQLTQVLQTISEQSNSLDNSEKEINELREMIKIANEKQASIEHDFEVYKQSCDKTISKYKAQRNGIGIVAIITIALIIIL